MLKKKCYFFPLAKHTIDTDFVEAWLAKGVVAIQDTRDEPFIHHRKSVIPEQIVFRQFKTKFLDLPPFMRILTRLGERNLEELGATTRKCAEPDCFKEVQKKSNKTFADPNFKG